MTPSSRPGEETDFSLVLGGPLYQMFRRAHLQGPLFEHMGRRLVFVFALTWVPILVLSAASGRLAGGEGLTFASDVETHVRFLFVVPLLIVAEWVVHERLHPVVGLFLERGIVTAKDTPRFRADIVRALAARNSVAFELLLLVLAFTVGQWLWQRKVAIGAVTWYAVPNGGSLHLTLPGYWFAFISIPIAQFLIFRWYFRLLIWSWLLWRISRLDLCLLPTHADRAGGLSFLGSITYAFVPLLFAEGALVAGVIANRILYQGQSVASFQDTVESLLVFFVLVVLGPLTFFTSKMIKAKRRGWFEYGTLATTYSADFDQKWLRGGAKGEPLLGTADIQSLADLGNSVAILREMRFVPFSLGDAAVLLGATAVPLLPVVLLAMPLKQLLSQLIKVIL
jgi:hypothetical protein